MFRDIHFFSYWFLAKKKDLFSQSEKKLANADYLSKAPADVVAKEMQKLADNKDRLSTLM